MKMDFKSVVYNAANDGNLERLKVSFYEILLAANSASTIILDTIAAINNQTMLQAYEYVLSNRQMQHVPVIDLSFIGSIKYQYFTTV